MEKKVIDLEIIDDIAESGVDAIALVDSPAIEKNWLYFRKEKFVNPKKGESQSDFMSRCVPYVMKEGKEQDQAVAQCISTYENMSGVFIHNTFADYPWDECIQDQLDKGLSEESANNICGWIKANMSSNFADYPWDECIQDQLDKGLSEESANNICGWIKANMGKFEGLNTITADVPLFLRLLEWIYEEKPSDEEVHKMIETATSLSASKGSPLTMDDYDQIIGGDIGKLEFDKVSFDWDDTLSTKRGKELADFHLKNGDDVYIITARSVPGDDLLNYAKSVGIPKDRIFATGSNDAKVAKVKSLGIKTHIDNNSYVIEALPGIGQQFDISVAAPAYTQIVKRRKRKGMQFENMCPLSTRDVLIDLTNQQHAIDSHYYGPENPALPNEEYWKMKSQYRESSVTVAEAKTQICATCANFNKTKKIMDCIINGIGKQIDISGYDKYDAGEIGYCQVFDFKAASERGCISWQPGGPIEDKQLPTHFNQSKILETAKTLGFSKEDFKTNGMEFNEIPDNFNLELAKGYTVYKYSGPVSSDTRDFCREMVNLDRFYTFEEINAMGSESVNPGFGLGGSDTYDIWKYKGGPNCKHRWQKFYVTAEGTFQNKGPAPGIAGEKPYNMPNHGYAFADAIAPKVGDAVSWQDQTGNCRGRIKEIVVRSKAIPGSVQRVDGSITDPAYIIEVYEKTGGKWSPTGKLVGKKGNELIKNVELWRQVFADEFKKEILGPVAIPDMEIPRKDKNGNIYFVRFSKDVIRRMAEKFMSELRLKSTNIQHKDNVDAGTNIVESWLVENPEDKANSVYGLDVPVGSWMVRAKVTNPQTWNRVKSGELQGWSLQGKFVTQAEYDDYMKDKKMYQDLVELVSGF